MRDRAPVAPQPELDDDVADDARGARGFTLLEVMIAVAILSMSLTSLLSSQMAAMRATRYARGVSVAAFLAESKLLDLEAQLLVEGWGTADKTFEGEFNEEGWPDIRYECLVDFIEVPDFSVLQQAKDNADTDGAGAGGMFVAGADDQAFSGIGMVWPMIKGAIEQGIRKPSCTVYWTDGALEHEFTVETFWTDVKQLNQLPQAGGEVDGTDDAEEDPADPAGGGGGGGAGGGTGAGGRGGGTTPTGQPGIGGPTGPRGGLK
ncbi:MAG: prepilin-type N-terminal cleavage/methylation domain-containing protein [Deltaproteobacteria bacterium]|nr:prepilin-type N-terminal cleavage/methylation domain-containing protein [Nannocystaceae bacterium]